TEALPHRIKNVATNISGPSRAEVLPGPPLDRMINIGSIVAGRSAPEPQIPVQRLGRRCSFRRPRTFQAIILHCARAVRAQTGMLYLADPPFFEPLHCRSFVRARGHLRPKLGDNTALDGRPGQRSDFCDVMAQWFLAIDVPAALDRTEGDREVHMV